MAMRMDSDFLDAKTRRKLADQRRMAFRRAIEDRNEQLRLEQELTDYPELLSAPVVMSAQVSAH
ncbi:PA3496 family putative envelope integrity protein [Pseudomonas asuensis]|jgi:hypothetical protein|uniref:Transcriptional regulator n=1 Tax=Pseudomonas asuensis TaxID=1825787 RepID=A0ABQ2GSP4_9PSED|nr:transcriptional regulator [Pseudomonas asuensis]GGM11466.1 hypothetical protein GCM10009425_23040 [Pseudomonas asuensis]